MMPEKSKHSEIPENSISSQQSEKSIASTFIEYGKTIFITLLAAFILKLFVVEAYRIPSTSMENTLKVGDFLLVNKLAYGIRTPHHLPFTAAYLPSFTIPLLHSVRRGDVVVFEYPGSRDEIKPSESVNYIKRCIGLPGDTVQIKSGNVFINGFEISFPPFCKQESHQVSNLFHRSSEMFPEGSTFNDDNYGPIIVPKRGDTLQIDPASFFKWRVFIEREGHTVRSVADKILVDGAIASTYRVQRDYYFVLGDNRNNSMDSRYWGFVTEDRLIGEALFVYWSWNPEVSVSSLSEKFSTIRWERIGTLIK